MRWQNLQTSEPTVEISWMHSLKPIAISPLNICHSIKRHVIFQPLIFRGKLSFREFQTRDLQNKNDEISTSLEGTNSVDDWSGMPTKWWLVEPPNKKMHAQVKLDHVPNFRDEHKKCLSCHHLDNHRDCFFFKFANPSFFLFFFGRLPGFRT